VKLEQTPFKGWGGNQALRDAISLSRAVYATENIDDKMLQEFEKNMLKGVAGKVSKSRIAVEALHGGELDILFLFPCPIASPFMPQPMIRLGNCI
jgi:hypothetical protein